MGTMYLLWAYKFPCFITTINHIARKFNLLLPIPYKGTLMIVEKNSYKFYNRCYWPLSTIYSIVQNGGGIKFWQIGN